MTAWRAVYCTSGAERRAHKELLRRGFTSFCPYESFKRHKVVAGKTVGVTWIETALFPGYLFSKTDRLAELQSVPGVVGVVTFGKRAITVPSAVVDGLKVLTSEDGLVSRADLTRNSAHFSGKVGDSFAFKTKSPLAGLIAEIASLANLDSSGEISAWIELFGSRREVSLPFTEVGKILTKQVA